MTVNYWEERARAAEEELAKMRERNAIFRSQMLKIAQDAEAQIAKLQEELKAVYAVAYRPKDSNA